LEQFVKDKHCKTCGLCDGTLCNTLFGELNINYDLPDKFPQTYNGCRFTSDAMDCALPIAIDSHSGCFYSCLYCFSNNLMRAPDRNPAVMERLIKTGSFYSEWTINKLERFLDGGLKDEVSKAMFTLLNQGENGEIKCPVQLGALGDPFDNLELHSGWAKKAIPLFIKYKVPVRVGTKGGIVLQRPEYLRLFEKDPENFWFAFSIITNSDELISKIDIRAPVTSERLKAMKLLTDLGCSASLRLRPFLPGVSDTYPGEPNAWEVLIDRCNEAGARAISFEYIFLNPAPTDRQKAMYRLMFKSMGNPNFGKEWSEKSKAGRGFQNEEGKLVLPPTGSVSCRRGSRNYKYDMTVKIRDKVHSLGWSFGCSDPHFKEFNDYGCCCAIPPTHPRLGNWSRRQLTNLVVDAYKDYQEVTAYNEQHQGEKDFVPRKQKQYTYKSWEPAWAGMIRTSACISLGDWHTHRKLRKQTFSDIMLKKWNNLKHPRGPFMYFGGILTAVDVDLNSDSLIYEYRPWDEKFDEKFIGEENLNIT
jgi:DNA repair photolyase